MASEHYRPDGSLAQGYYCSRCGAAGVNMLTSGHGEGKCHPNPTLVASLHRANSREGKSISSIERTSYEDKAVTAYWLKHYSKSGCTLCGNVGQLPGHRRSEWQYCVCPNGQAARHFRAPLNGNGS